MPPRLRFALLGLLPACSNAFSTNPDGCILILVASISPPTTSVAVGQSVQLSVSYNQVAPACVPNVPASALHWEVDDTTIATVDSTSGLVTGHAVGRTGVSVHAPDSTRVLGNGEVRVTGP